MVLMEVTRRVATNVDTPKGNFAPLRQGLACQQKHQDGRYEDAAEQNLRQIRYFCERHRVG